MIKIINEQEFKSMVERLEEYYNEGSFEYQISIYAVTGLLDIALCNEYFAKDNNVNIRCVILSCEQFGVLRDKCFESFESIVKRKYEKYKSEIYRLTPTDEMN